MNIAAFIFDNDMANGIIGTNAGRCLCWELSGPQSRLAIRKVTAMRVTSIGYQAFLEVEAPGCVSICPKKVHHST